MQRAHVCTISSFPSERFTEAINAKAFSMSDHTGNATASDEELIISRSS